MSNTDWTKNLKVGDEVALYYSGASGCKYSIATIERITPKGYLGVRGDIYDETRMRGKGWFNTVLRELTPEIRKEIDDYKIYRHLDTLLDKMRSVSEIKKRMTVEQAQAIIDILEVQE